MQRINLGEDFKPSAELIMGTTTIVGQKGSGKSTTGAVITEEAIDLGIPVATIDPTGAWWGQKSSADGKRPGKPVYIFGGEHADVPLDYRNGIQLARFIVEKRVPSIFDLKLLRKGQQVEFVTEFLETLFHLNREPLLLPIDEAARFCPQLVRPDLARCVGAVEDCVTLGRSRGLYPMLITQRLAMINKNVATQSDTLIVMRTMGPQDRKAVHEWCVEQDAEQQKESMVVSEMPRLKTGTGYVWSPQLLGTFEKVKFRDRETFDSSRTPRIGEKKIEARVFAAVDLEKLTEELKVSAQAAEENNPKALKAKIAELQKQIKEQPPQIKRIEIPVPSPELREQLEACNKAMEAIAKAWIADVASKMEQMRPVLEKIFAQLGHAQEPTKIVAPMFGEVHDAQAQPEKAAELLKSDFRPQNGSSLKSGALRLLCALGQYAPRGLTRSELTVLSGIKLGPTFSTYFSMLRARGFIEERGGNVHILASGQQYIGKRLYPPTTPDELLSIWNGKFKDGARRMLDVVVRAYPRSVTRNALQEQVGIKAGPTFSTYLSTLRSAKLIAEDEAGLRAVALDLLRGN